jgi:hypothetical protein
MRMQKQDIKYKINKMNDGWYEVCSHIKETGWMVEGTIGSLKNARLFKKMLIEEEWKKWMKSR